MPRPENPELRVECRKCHAQPGHHCVSPKGTRVNSHTVRVHDAYADAVTPEEQADRAHERAMADAQFDKRTLVRLSFGYSCGCSTGPGEPVPLIEANVYGVARPIICDRHNEFAVITRVTTRLVADEDTLRRILLAAGDIGEREDDGQNYTVDSIAAEQSDANRAKIRAGDPTADRYTIYG